MNKTLHEVELLNILDSINNVEKYKDDQGGFLCCYFSNEKEWLDLTINSLIEMGMKVTICTREEYINETGWIPEDNRNYFYLVNWEVRK